MSGFWLGVSALFGLLVGSFLNVCIFRLPRNCMSVVKPRSRCPRCLAWIAWYDNLPVVSWLALGGRCRGCRAPIPIRYTLVELLTGGLYAFAAWRLLVGGGPRPPAEAAVIFLTQAWFLGALVVSTFVDLEFKILPDEVTLSGLLIGVVLSAAFPYAHQGAVPLENRHLGGLVAAVLGAALGGGSIYTVGVLGKLLFRKEAMGFGDVKFMAMVGALLGWKGALLTLLMACLLGSLYGLGRFVVVRRMGYVPFGPFLSGGALVVLFASLWVESGIDAYRRLMEGLFERVLGRGRA